MRCRPGKDPHLQFFYNLLATISPLVCGGGVQSCQRQERSNQNDQAHVTTHDGCCRSHWYFARRGAVAQGRGTDEDRRRDGETLLNGRSETDEFFEGWIDRSSNRCGAKNPRQSGDRPRQVRFHAGGQAEEGKGRGTRIHRSSRPE